MEYCEWPYADAAQDFKCHFPSQYIYSELFWDIYLGMDKYSEIAGAAQALPIRKCQKGSQKNSNC